MMSALLAMLLLPPPQPPPQAALPAVVLSSYVPQRVFDTRQKGFSDFESMLADLARADAVFVGEQHDDGNTHRLELAVVEGLTRRGVSVVVALEMFERDVQGQVDSYAAGRISEEQFVKDARAWPRYASDYRPLIEFAKAHHLAIVASNVPRRIAADVSKKGLSAIDGLGADRPLAARELQCPASGDYYQRFGEAMGGHEGTNANFYFAQCVKDETMGEAVADAFERNATGRVTIVHVNGAFHSDFSEGTAESARRRMPGRRIAVVTMVPSDDLDTVKPDDTDFKRADYLVFTLSKSP
jgi:uncharacterized iron-regulated protein